MNINRIIFSFFNRVLISLKIHNLQVLGKCTFLIAKVINTGQNTCIFQDSAIVNSVLKTEGNGNVLKINGNIRNSNLLLVGVNNQLFIGKEVFILNMKIVLRGSNCKVIIGNNTTLGGGYIVCMGVENEIVIGEDCQIADDVSIWATDSHPIYDVDGNIYNDSKPIYIEDHVWIGNKSIILKGVNIGKDSVIGMGSVVTKSIEPNSLYVGNPAKKIKEIKTWDRSFITK